MITRIRPGVTIRIATANDASIVLNLVRDVYHEYGFIFEAETETPDLLAFEQHYYQPTSTFFVALIEGQLVGSVGVKFYEPTISEIYRLYLNSKFRGLGVGRQLLDRAIAWSRENGGHKITLWSDTRFTLAHKLYIRAGFVQSNYRELAGDPNHTVEYQFTLAF